MLPTLVRCNAYPFQPALLLALKINNRPTLFQRSDRFDRWELNDRQTIAFIRQ
jgi:hypothetical protein